jgi:hypothetical protein
VCLSAMCQLPQPCVELQGQATGGVSSFCVSDTSAKTFNCMHMPRRVYLLVMVMTSLLLLLLLCSCCAAAAWR